MRRGGKAASSILFFVFAVIATVLCLPLLRAQTVNVDVSMSNQTLEGWGTSLAWFANSVGGWTNTTNQTALMNALFSPTSGLGLNYLRYNIGGGDNPNCGQSGYYACISPARQLDPGYEPTAGTYDWTQDANQRWVAQNAQSLGANLFEAISYSPPYWMTNSGTSQGGANGAENLASGYYGSGSGTFADYLTTVAQHFSTNWGITFHHLEPLNEPGQTWWVAGAGKQEGCGFSVADQQTMIQDVASSLAAKSMAATGVSAMDENSEGVLNASTGTTAYEFYNYNGTTLGDFTALNTHGYSSTYGSVAVATDAQHAGKRVTMSEWGTSANNNDASGQNLSTQLLLDINLTRAVAWSIWQPDWPALMTIDYTNQAYTLNEAYYVYENFTKFIRPGFQFIAISDPQSLAAYNARTQTLVIVTLNWTGSSRNVTYQLSNFTSVGSSAAVYQTSSTEQLASLGNATVANASFSYAAPSDSVTTYVIQNAAYTPTATSANDNTTGTGLNQFNYSGSWSYYANQPGAYDNDNHWSSTTNNYYTFEFSGQQARIYASMSPNGGIAAFSVDNGAETYFDTYAATRVDDVLLFATPTLGNGTHTLKVRVTGLKNPASSGYNVPADRIDVVGAGSEVGQDIYKIVNVKNGKDLEVNSASLADGGTVDTYADVSGANNEHWNLMAVGDGSYRIVNVNSGLDLEVSGSSQSNGGTVNQWQDSGSSATNEHWTLVPVSGGYRIVNVNSGLDLEVNGTSGVVDQWQDVSGAPNEHWTLTLTN
jgi:O-Glycosyl hydrolase family 30/Ricin-type beta-trefoil lectin domain-like